VTDYGHALEFGVFITPAAADADAVVELATVADQAGLDLVSFQDHPYQSRFLDAWTLLAFVAARTRRVRLAPNVLNLPLRPPAVVARAVASLDRLSGGRATLGIGAGAFWDAIAAMGGRRLTGGESVDALAEAIAVIRALWDAGERGGARFHGAHYRLDGAARGPAPLHDVPIWIGAYKPRMLRLVGREADGWLPTLSYLERGGLASGNAAIDAAAAEAGRDPAAIRRLVNLGGPLDPEELARMALEDGVGTFIAMADDAGAVRAFAEEVAPAVRERVAAARSGAPAAEPAAATAPAATEVAATVGEESEYDRLGVRPTADDGRRLSAVPPWDESTRPHRPRSGPEVDYSRRGRLVGQHLVDVHDVLRKELGELRDVLTQVRDGALAAGEARSALNDMALRQNDWTLGAFCARYCGAVAAHHGLEDDAIFPHLARSETALGPVVERLADEHLVIHDAIQGVDRALVEHITRPEDFEPIQAAIDFLSDALLSHLAYEEHELVEPLARHGFYPGQL
jgi:alkanesulfonate monooxygenase SsuD/methylene tetrahydromethanopterin reductase-like flavin-dependent oxidoreductase (luciferase family)